MSAGSSLSLLAKQSFAVSSDKLKASIKCTNLCHSLATLVEPFEVTEGNIDSFEGSIVQTVPYLGTWIAIELNDFLSFSALISFSSLSNSLSKFSMCSLALLALSKLIGFWDAAASKYSFCKTAVCLSSLLET